MASLLDSVQSYVTSEILSSAASALGESESGISKAIGGLAPTILAGILNKSGDANAMGNIFSVLSDSKNAGFLDNLGGLIGGGNLAKNDPKDIAGNLMGQLFGGKVGAILNALSSFAGLKSSSTSSLLGMVGPLVMGVLNKKIASQGLNVSGLTKMLMGEKDSIMSALPSGLGSVMGLADLGGTKPTTPAADIQREEPKAATNWMLPLLLIAALGAAYMFFKGGCSAPAVDTDKVEQKVSDAKDAVAETATDAKDAVAGFMKKIGDFELKGNADGVEAGLIGFIESDKAPCKVEGCWFSFDRLTFATGSAKLDMELSKDQLTNIVEIMKAYPKVSLKIGGYTDNTGSKAGNMKLSGERANAVMAALISMGVDGSRLAAEGYGDAHPVASNDTEEGRAQNRRIDVRVSAK